MKKLKHVVLFYKERELKVIIYHNKYNSFVLVFNLIIISNNNYNSRIYFIGSKNYFCIIFIYFLITYLFSLL